MTFKSNNADASFYYRESAAVDIARMDSSAVYGNLADAMKNATVLLPYPQIIRTIMISPQYLNNIQVDPENGYSGDETIPSDNQN